MNGAHTPGPWLWQKVQGDQAITEWTLGGPTVLCRYWYDKEPDADARLIAAAPELLEALEAMRETIPVDISYYEHFMRESLPLPEGEQRAYEALKKFEPAISKARGTK